MVQDQAVSVNCGASHPCFSPHPLFCPGSSPIFALSCSDLLSLDCRTLCRQVTVLLLALLACYFDGLVLVPANQGGPHRLYRLRPADPTASSSHEKRKQIIREWLDNFLPSGRPLGLVDVRTVRLRSPLYRLVMLSTWRIRAHKIVDYQFRTTPLHFALRFDDMHGARQFPDAQTWRAGNDSPRTSGRLL